MKRFRNSVMHANRIFVAILFAVVTSSCTAKIFSTPKSSSLAAPTPIPAFGPAAKLVFTVQPSNSNPAGSVFYTSPVVAVKDASNVTVITSNNPVTLSAFTDSTCSTSAGGTLSAAINPVMPSNGLAIFSSLTYSPSKLIYIKATSGTLTSDCSNLVVVGKAISAFNVAPPTFIPALSNNSAAVHGGRYFSEATLLADGNILVTGGRFTNNNADVTNIVTLYNSTTGHLKGLPPMSVARMAHTATLAPNGKVIVVGGMVDNTNGTTNVQAFNPTTQLWESATSITGARGYHSATLLNDGRIFVTGGYTTGAVRTNTTWLYDPLLDTWTAGPNLTSNRSSHGAVKLGDGKVLIMGGHDGTSTVSIAEIYDPGLGTITATGSMTGGGRQNFGNPIYLTPTEAGGAYTSGAVFVGGGDDGSAAVLNTITIYNVALGTWSAGTGMNANRVYPSFVKLSDGKIFVAGGNTAYGSEGQTTLAQTYDPTLDNWTARASLSGSQGGASFDPRAKFKATLLTNGKIFIFGGSNQATPLSLPTSLLYDVIGDSWTNGPTFGSPVNNAKAWVLGNGKIMSCGGAFMNNQSTPVKFCELYDYATNQVVDGPNLNVARSRFADVQLADGRIVVVGGTITSGAQLLKSTEVFDPTTETWTLKANNPMFGMNYALFQDIGGNKIAVAGGQGGATAFTTGPMNQTYIYDVDADTWTAGTSMPVGLARSVSVGFAGRYFVSGGCDNLGTNNIVDTMYEYIPGSVPSVNDSWVTLTNSGQVQSWHVLFPYNIAGNNYIASIGGATIGDLTAITAVNKVYSLSGNTWTTGTSMPAGRTLHAGVVQNGKILLMGGYNIGGQSSVYEYTPGTIPGTNDSMVTLTNLNIAKANYSGHVAVLMNDGRIFLPGGSGGANPDFAKPAQTYSRVTTQTITPSGGDYNYTWNIISGPGTLYPLINQFIPPYPFPGSGTQTTVRINDGLGSSADSVGTFP